MSHKKIYAVLKLVQKVAVEDARTKEKNLYKVEGILGYIPVFKTLKEAEIESEGKFEILIFKQ